ncbi:MAG: hypothetical protein E4G92_06785, partial [Bacteroidia bacterium]
MKKIIVIGTGNLGKRYLQAILSVSGSFTCHCYDINRDALDGLQDFLHKNNIPDDRLTKHYELNEILGVTDSNALVIIASTAAGRRSLISGIIERRPESMIVEKPVAQTREDYLAIMEECKSMNVPSFTHYTLRFQPFCKLLKERVREEKSFELISFLPAMGLACVSIHYIDLFLWLFDITSPELSGYDFQGTYEQKRKGFQDMYGEIIIKVPGRGTGRFINSEVNGIR